jgi:flagellar basal body-associated protein FliL
VLPSRPPRQARPTAGSIRTLALVGMAALVGAVAAYLLQGRTVAETDAQATAPSVLPPVVYQIGNFLVNVGSEGELRFLRVEVAAAIRGYQAASDEDDNDGHGGGHGSAKTEASDAQLPKLQADDEAMARDLIVTILSAGSFDGLRTSAGRQHAKQQIKQALCEVIEGAEVEQVLFVAFVMQ